MSLDLIHKLAIGDRLAWRIASGDLELPANWVLQTMDHYDFPPAFVPLWRDGISTIGYWRHWFCEGRKSVLVEIDPEDGYQARIRSRTLSQLLITFVMDVMEMRDEMTPDVESFVLGVGLGAPDKIAIFLDDHDVDGKWEKLLGGISGDPPTFLDSSFKKDFLDQDEMSSKKLLNFCGLEFDTNFSGSIVDGVPWFAGGNQQQLFAKLLEENKYDEAWLTLHSRGWNVLQIEKALTALAIKSGNSEFQSFAQAWIKLNHQSLEY